MSVHNENSKSLKSSLFVDYKPAELKIASQWLVVYYAKNPITQTMQRFRVVVPVLKNKTERIKHGKKIAHEINRKLATGWLPFYSDTNSNDFKTYQFCKTKFLEQLASDITKGLKRADTERSYKSYFNMIELYVAKKNLKLNFVFEINRSFIINYLDFILYERNNSARTYNNHLAFFIGFFNFCLVRGFAKENCAVGIVKKKNAEKIRQNLTHEIKLKIKSLEQTNFGFYAVCMITYYCFVRRTELTKLKVHHINFEKNFITIPAEFSKNGKTENVTVPNAYLEILKLQTKNANMNDFIFSADNFKAGAKQLNPKRISDNWERCRKVLQIENKYQFYSLKDTGITDLLNAGIPAIKVRDQARHHDLKITEKYTSRNQTSDEIIKNAGVNF